MPEPTYKFSEGFEYLMFPGNFGLGAASYNFPESTAQDLDAGAISIAFSGSQIPLNPGGVAVGFRYGASGHLGRYTPLVMMTGSAGFTSVSQIGNSGQNFQRRNYPLSIWGAPPLSDIFFLKTFSTAAIGGEDNTTLFPPRLKNQRSFNSIAEIETLDLISEGPIEGFVTGQYIYDLSGKNIGDIGYNSATFIPFDASINNDATSRSIFYNDVPLTDFQGFSNFQYLNYKFTYGEPTNDHTIYNPYLNLYEDRYNYWGRKVDINKIPLQTSTTKVYDETLYGFYVISGSNAILSPKTYYVYNTEVSAIKVNIKVNSLFEQILTGANAGETTRQNLNFAFSIYRILNDGQLVLLDTSKYFPYIKDYYSYDEIGLRGKITSPTIFTYEIVLRPYAENDPNFPLFPNQIGWAIDITKRTRESVTPSIGTSTDIFSITEVYSDRFTYPNTAMVWSKFDARYFDNVPTRTYKLRLLKVKVPINYDPITRRYSGAWNGKFKVAWTDNPAWCFYDLITNNRYGLGKYIDANLTDKWTLYEIAQYCDEFVSDGAGGLEPRFRCNLYIANKEEAYKVLNDMASIFRGIVYYSAGQIFVNQDSPKDSIYLFNNSNVINGVFNYSDSSKKSRKTVAFVRYNDANDNFKPNVEYIEDINSILKYGIRETQIAAFGCTSKNQARRIGKWILATENLETETVNFDVGLEGNFVRPGDVISIYDQDRRNQVYAGRTLELTTGYAVLDIPYNSLNTYAITGVINNLTFDVLTPTYNLNYGTYLGDLYVTGFNNTSSGVSGINSSFTRKGQIQSISITNPRNYITSGSGIYANNIRINFPSILSNSGYSLPQNTVWSIDLNTSGYNLNGLDVRSEINNPLDIVYPGYYLEPFLNKPKKYRILTITEKEQSSFSINALEYNEQKYIDVDNTSLLVNVPVKPGAPTTPNLILSGLFRTPDNGLYSYRNSLGVPYTSNQGGINSITYNIIPRNNSINNTLYYVYVKSGTNFQNNNLESIYLKDILSPQNLRTGYNYLTGDIPPFFTPLYSGRYFFNVFAENSIGEKSSSVTGMFVLPIQANVFTVSASGDNVY